MTILKGTPLSPRRRSPTRPYANKRGGPPSVTTVIGVIDKPGLMWGAANETAAQALDYPDRYTGDRDAAYDALRKFFRGIWDGRAAMGTMLHHINEAWTWGETVDVETLIAEAAYRAKSPVRSWQGHEDWVLTEANGYLDGLERFWTDWKPETVATEEVVRTTGGRSYIGQRDWTCRLADGKLYQLDLKSSGKTEEGEGIYPAEWRLQHAAYRFAAEIVTYDAAGVEDGAVPNYPVDACANVVLRGDGRYELYEVEADTVVLDRFAAARYVWQWVNREAKSPPPALRAAPALVESVMNQ